MAPVLTEDDEDESEDVGCTDCGVELTSYVGGVVLAQVRYPQETTSGVFCGLALYETEDGDSVYDPLFHCMGCFEELVAAVQLLQKDSPPVPFDGPVTCDYCHSGIGIEESCVQLEHGELVISGKTGRPKFMPSNWNSPVMCLGCVVQVNGSLDREEGMLLLWPDLANDDECPTCTVARCWRAEGCPCDCHKESA